MCIPPAIRSQYQTNTSSVVFYCKTKYKNYIQLTQTAKQEIAWAEKYTLRSWQASSLGISRDLDSISWGQYTNHHRTVESLSCADKNGWKPWTYSPQFSWGKRDSSGGAARANAVVTGILGLVKDNFLWICSLSSSCHESLYWKSTQQKEIAIIVCHTSVL